MKKYLIIAFFLLILPNIGYAKDNKATLINLDTCEKYAVEINSEFSQGLFANGFELMTPERNCEGLLGSFVPSTGYSERLTSSITATVATIPVSSVKDKDGFTLPLSATNKGYFNLEPGTSRQESMVCTGTSGSSLTGCTRGLDASTSSETSSSTLRFVHNAGSKIIMSNIAQFFGNYMDIWTDQTASGTKTFINYPEKSGTENATTSRQLITLGQANAIVNQGAATSTENVAGISELATRIESASSTPFDIENPHVQQSEHATSTPSSNISSLNGGLWDVWSENDGKINQSWIDYSEDIAFSGDNTYSATSTFNGLLIGNPVVPMIASTTITGLTLPQPVYIASSTDAEAGGVLLVDADDLGTLEFAGFAVTSASSGEIVYVQTGNIVSGFTGLTKGAKYFVQDAVGTIGTTVGTFEVLVGTAISATEILIDKGDFEYTGSVSVNTDGTTTSVVPTGIRQIIVVAFKAASGDATDGIGASGGEIVLTKQGLTASLVSMSYAGGTGGSPTNNFRAFRATWVTATTITAKTFSGAFVTEGEDTGYSITAYFYR